MAIGVIDEDVLPGASLMRIVNHVGLTVTDLERSVAFYRDVVGLDVQVEHFHTGGEWFDTLTGNSGAVIDGAMLGDESFCLQLLQYQLGGEPEPVTGHNRVGNLHLSINVADVVAKRDEILAGGTQSPTPLVELPLPGARSFYVHDPDGVPVEFMQLDETA
jgi:catechol 2,3-dioxygenase-like lactoylglutathione lyase family enzyme